MNKVVESRTQPVLPMMAIPKLYDHHHPIKRKSMDWQLTHSQLILLFIFIQLKKLRRFPIILEGCLHIFLCVQYYRTGIVLWRCNAIASTALQSPMNSCFTSTTQGANAVQMLPRFQWTGARSKGGSTIFQSMWNLLSPQFQQRQCFVSDWVSNRNA